MEVQAEDLQKEFDRAVRQWTAEDRFSGVVAVMAPEHEPFIRAYGQANRAAQMPNEADTRFGIASLGKMFTAVAIGQLAQRGKIQFRASVRDYLPSIAKRLNSKITFHHLLTHTSGLADYTDDDLAQDASPDWVWSRTPCYLMRKTSDYLPLILGKAKRFEPGAQFSLCNAGYILLGLVIEEISGISYSDYVAANIFAPAGMSDAGFFALDEARDRVARGYLPDPKRQGSLISNIYSLPAMGSADRGAYCTAMDLHRFFDALQNLRLVSEPIAHQLFEPRVQLDELQSYGYGFWVRNLLAGQKMIGHSGEEAGFSARAYRMIDPAVTIVVLSNLSDSSLAPFERLLRLVVPNE